MFAPSSRGRACAREIYGLWSVNFSVVGERDFPRAERAPARHAHHARVSVEIQDAAAGGVIAPAAMAPRAIHVSADRVYVYRLIKR